MCDEHATENGATEKHLDAEIPPIDVVAEEEVPRIGGAAADLEQLHEVILNE